MADETRFLDLLDLAAAGIDRFEAPPAPEEAGLMYGGQYLAQSVAAALRTVSGDRSVHSLHGLFLGPGDVSATTEVVVDRVRDGRSFSTRSVSCQQAGRELFRGMVSLHVLESGLTWEPAPETAVASLPAPEAVTMTYVEFCHGHPDMADREWHGDQRPMEIRYVDPPDPSGGPPSTATQRTWTRIAGTLPDDPAVHQAGLAYLSDATLIDHVLLPHGHRWSDRRLTGVSLDHAMWLHRPTRADEWILFEQRVEATGSARGLASGRLFDVDGRLAASCSQEGLMRWNDPS